MCEECSLERTPLSVDKLSLAEPTIAPLDPPHTTTPNLYTDARASTYNSHQPHRSIEVRVYLDSGSYISERAKGEHILHIDTFDSTRKGPKYVR